MSKVLIITEKYIKANSIIDENVDVKLLRSTIYDCQKDYIKPLLGAKLYDKIISDINGGTLVSDYLELVNEYVAEVLLKWVVFESVPTLLFKYRNKSVSKQNSDHSNPISYSEMRSEMNRWKDKAEVREKSVIDYLCDNHSKFPEYNKSKHSDSSYTTSIYLG